LTDVGRVIGRGWATVDIERAAAELSHLVAGGGFEPVERSTALGARCLRARALDVSEGEWIVVLEPDTEGRLAAFLARHAEGWAATWEGAGGVALTGSRPGPLGPERLQPGQPMSGPFRLITTAATIDP
jgi:hypothetical protein